MHREAYHQALKWAVRAGRTRVARMTWGKLWRQYPRETSTDPPPFPQKHSALKGKRKRLPEAHFHAAGGGYNSEMEWRERAAVNTEIIDCKAFKIVLYITTRHL